jgi:hypothetical protein
MLTMLNRFYSAPLIRAILRLGIYSQRKLRPEMQISASLPKF